MPVFLFTDIEGSTQLWEKHHGVMAKALSRHDAILQSCIEEHGGKTIKHTGDGVFAVFHQGDPLQCALDMQQRVAAEPWGALGELRVRVALHAGDADERGGDYFGPTINRTARVLATGWGGQVLLTPEVASSSRLPAGAALRDLGVHLLKDLSQPQQVYGLVHPRLPLQEFPPLRSLSGHPHNLPVQPTPFLGREKELAELLARLDNPSCRLLTVVGPGGCGKTRLALQAGAERIEAFTHGVYLVPLDPVSSADFLVPTIADALKFSFYSQQDPRAQLINFLREKSLLLVLDNFEHLVAGADLLAEILAAAPGVKVLVTSRERLNVQGEWLLEISGMARPPDPRAGDIEAFDAVRLFLQTAQRVSPGFALSPEDRAAVVRICDLVEGLPLGIELAAGWVRALSCDEIAQEIETNIGFLEGFQKKTPERHRSLWAVFEHSWKLLPQAEKETFRRMSVFAGGFRREAGEKVAGSSLRLLLSLVDKSLLRRNPAGRYETLTSLRHFGEEKLRETPGPWEEVQDRHCGYYADFLHRAGGRLIGERQQEALQGIGDEIENVRKAWDRAVGQRKVAELGLALEALSGFYDRRGWYQEGEQAFGKAAAALGGRAGLEATRGGTEGLALARSLARQGLFHFRLGQYGQATQLLQQTLPWFRQSGSRQEEGFCLNSLGLVARMTGQWQPARESLQNGLALAREGGDSFGVALSLHNLGIVAFSEGDYAGARRLYLEALALRRQIGDRQGMAFSLNNLGNVAVVLKDYAEATKLYKESTAVFEGIGNRWGSATCLNNSACSAYYSGDCSEARQLHERGLAIFREIGDRWGVANTLVGCGDAACALGEHEEADAHFREALAAAMELRAVPLALHALTGLATLATRKGDKERALALVSFVLGHPATEQEARGRAEALRSELQPGHPPETVSHGSEDLAAVVADVLRGQVRTS